MRTKLEMYSKMTMKRGGVWYRLDESVLYRLDKKNGYSVYKIQTKYTKIDCRGYTSFVYQIFNADGKIVYQSTNFTETMREFGYLTEFLKGE